jgi:superoxide reductase
MKAFGELIYSPDRASGEAITKVESHTPKIEAPDKVKPGELFTIKVTVGPHPNTAEHSIRWVEIYFYEEGRAFNPVMLARTFFAPGYVEPEVTVKAKLNKSGVIYAIAYCNLHGLWEGRKEVKVEG